MPRMHLTFWSCSDLNRIQGRLTAKPEAIQHSPRKWLINSSISWYLGDLCHGPAPITMVRLMEHCKALDWVSYMQRKEKKANPYSTQSKTTPKQEVTRWKKGGEDRPWTAARLMDFTTHLFICYSILYLYSHPACKVCLIWPQPTTTFVKRQSSLSTHLIEQSQTEAALGTGLTTLEFQVHPWHRSQAA